uniref:Uncharacterized protein n=1 Tax=viral metagenome TaxID=1070528 RepID=A0A6M3J3P0_9ZZZZ
MVMTTKVKAIQVGTTSEINLKATRDGELRVVQYLPVYAQLCAAGKVFGIETTAGTAKAPVAVMPTTTATWSLYNANTTASLVVIKVALASISGTLGLGGAIIGTVPIGDQTAVTSNYSGAIVGCMDGTAKTPSAYIANATTLIGTQSPWNVLSSRDMLAVIGVGAGMVANVNGMMVVPPLGSAGFDVLAPVGTTALFAISIVFAEVTLDT